MIIGLLTPAVAIAVFLLWLTSNVVTAPKFLPGSGIMTGLFFVLAIATISTGIVLAYRPECSYSEGAALNIQNGVLQAGYFPAPMNRRSRRDYCYDISGTPGMTNSLVSGVSVLGCCKGDCTACNEQQCGVGGRAACCLSSVAKSAQCVWNETLRSEPPCAVPLPIPAEPLHPETTAGNQMISSPSGECGDSTSDDPLIFDFRLSEVSLNFDVDTLQPSNCRNPNFYSMEPAGHPSQEFRLECDAWDGKIVSTAVAQGSFTDLAGNLNTNAGQCSLTSDTTCAAVSISARDGLGNEIDCASAAATMHPPVVFTLTRTEDSPGFSLDGLPADQFSLSGCTGMITAIGFPDSTFTCPQPGNLQFHSAIKDAAGNTCGGGPGAGGALDCNINADTGPPAVAISSPNGPDHSIVNDDTIIFEFTLSEDSADFTAYTVNAVNCPKPEWYPKVGGVPTDYILKCKSVDGDVSVTVEPSTFTDLAGNANAQGDTYALKVVLGDKFSVAMQPSIAGTPIPCDSKVSGGPVVFTFTLSEPSANFGLGALITENCANPAFTGNSTVFQLACDGSPAGAAPAIIAVTLPSGKFTDSAGNFNNPLDRCAITSDDQAPNVIISSPTSPNGGVASIGDGCASNLLEMGQQKPKKVTFGFLVNECSDFRQDSITLQGCSDPEFTADADSSDTVNAVYQFWLECQPSAGKIAATVSPAAFLDCAGNKYVGQADVPNSYGFSMNVDASGQPQFPSVTISSPGILNGGATNAGTFTFVFDLSAPSVDFTADSITKNNCNSPVFVGIPGTEDQVYQLTCAASDSVSVEVPAHSWTSTQGDCNAFSAGFSINQDLTLPEVTISSEDGMDMFYAQSCQNCNNVTVHFDIHLSEASATLDAADLVWQINHRATEPTYTCPGSTFSKVSDTEYVATCAGFDGDTVTIEVPPASFSDLAGNTNEDDPSYTLTVDLSAPTVGVDTDETSNIAAPGR